MGTSVGNNNRTIDWKEGVPSSRKARDSLLENLQNGFSANQNST